MRVSVGIILSLLVAVMVIQTTGSAYAGQCPPNCDPVAPPNDKGK